MWKNKNDLYNHVCMKLQDYMLTNKLLSYTSLLDKNNLKSPSKEKTSSSSHENNFFIPDEQDKLFWCFYVIVYGFEIYEFDKNSLFKIEKDFKIKSVEKIRKNKKLFKENKLHLSEIEDELVNHTKITLKGLKALCLLYNINILYTWNNKYFEIITNNNIKIHILCEINKQDSLLYETNEEKIQFYRDNCWKIENISKPLKGFTTYSIKELLSICQKLQIPLIDISGKNKIKKQLYQDILEKI